MSESTVALASTQTKPCVTKAGRLKVMRRNSSPMLSRPMKKRSSHFQVDPDAEDEADGADSR